MEDQDDQAPRKRYPLSPAKMSKTPSWIMLGFVLGALFVVALPPLGDKPAPKNEVQVRLVEPPAAPDKSPEPPQLTTIEAVFAEWGRHAVWSDDTTQVALWNIDKRAYSDFYEVRRLGGTYYFRTIPRLTRRIMTRGKPLPESPLQFTETEEQYQEWRQHGRTERPLEQRELRPTPRSAAPAEPPKAPPVPVTPPPRMDGIPRPLDAPPSDPAESKK
jgi:hypothetical protein